MRIRIEQSEGFISENTQTQFELLISYNICSNVYCIKWSNNERKQKYFHFSTFF